MSRRITTTDEKIISDVAIQPRQDASAARLLEAALEYVKRSEARSVNLALKDQKGTALVSISFVEEATEGIRGQHPKEDHPVTTTLSNPVEPAIEKGAGDTAEEVTWLNKSGRRLVQLIKALLEKLVHLLRLFAEEFVKESGKESGKAAVNAVVTVLKFVGKLLVVLLLAYLLSHSN